jgi:hypothetical protein
MFAGAMLKRILFNKGRDYVRSMGEAKNLDNLEVEIAKLGYSADSLEAEDIRAGAKSAMRE